MDPDPVLDPDPDPIMKVGLGRSRQKSYRELLEPFAGWSALSWNDLDRLQIFALEKQSLLSLSISAT